MASSSPAAQVLLITADGELRMERRVWGTGGWMMPGEREALDWLTLCRLLGWGVRVVHAGDADFEVVLSQDFGWIIVGCPPEMIRGERVNQLREILRERSVLAVARCAVSGSGIGALASACRSTSFVGGDRLRWLGPGPAREWSLRGPMTCTALDLLPGTLVWATLDGEPVVAAAQIGRGALVTLGFHPSEARDGHGSVTALLRHALTYGTRRAAAWYDFTNTLILRMDDPGGAQNVHSRSWCYSKLDEQDWMILAASLQRHGARLSIGYVSGWVDDGDERRGDLRVSGLSADRIRGAVHPSPLVWYHDRSGHAPGTVNDYRSEFRGITRLRTMGLGDVELHGYTHMHPDSMAWARAKDRYDGVDWFRELGLAHIAAIAARPTNQHPLRLGWNALQQFFGVRPTALICPGDQWTDASLETALDIGLDLVASYYLALRDGERFCWMTHVCAPYLNKPAEHWFDSGLPVVGYFHDREPAQEGIGWVDEWLDSWREVGAKRMIDFREFAGAVMRPLRLAGSGSQLRLTAEGNNAREPVRPLPIALFSPAGDLPSQLPVTVCGRTRWCALRHVGNADAAPGTFEISTATDSS